METILSIGFILWLIIDPIGNIPAFAAVLRSVPEDRRKWVLFRELCFALAIFIVFLLAGPHILTFLKLSNPALTISGGVLLFLISLNMIFPKPEQSYTTDNEPFIVPLAVPFLAGPSVLAMIVLFAQQHDLMTVSVALGGAWAASVVILLLSDVILKIIKNKGAVALERLTGMLLMVMAVQMMLNGIESYVQIFL